MKNDFVFASKIVDLSEEKDYLTLRNRVFFFNSPNLNNVQLDYDESSLEKCRSLINMPLVARYIQRNGQDDLGGHEVKVVNGEYEFQTAAIGTITDVDIIEEDVETVDGTVKRLPCLYATERVWTRFKNATRAVKTLFSSGNLNNSWELKSNDYRYKDGIKLISDYTFLGNCLLGTGSFPAYGRSGARVLDISESSDNYEYLAADTSFEEALALDLSGIESASNINQNKLDGSESDREEEKLMDANENIVIENSEVNTEEEAVEVVNTEETAEVNKEEQVNNETPEVSEGDSAEDDGSVEGENENPETDNSEPVPEEEGEQSTETSEMLTEEDIRRMVGKAVDNLHSDKDEWYYVAMIFPEEKIVFVQSYKMKTLQYKQFSYRIDGDKAVLENEKDIELTISPLNINSEIEAKNNAIADANSKIIELEAQVSELNKVKEELDTIKAEQENKERAEAIDKLRNYVVNSGRFTSEEIDSDPVKSAIDNLNESWLKAEIADRFIASLHKDNVDVSESNNSVSIILSEEVKPVTSEDVMRAFFNN